MKCYGPQIVSQAIQTQIQRNASTKFDCVHGQYYSTHAIRTFSRHGCRYVQLAREKYHLFTNVKHDMLDLPFGWVCVSLCISSPDLTDIQNDIIEMIKIHDQPPIEGRISGLPGTVRKDITCDLCTQATLQPSLPAQNGGSLRFAISTLRKSRICSPPPQASIKSSATSSPVS